MDPLEQMETLAMGGLESNVFKCCAGYGIHRARCWTLRHERFNPGPPSMTKRQRRDRAHAEALIEDAERTKAKAAA